MTAEQIRTARQRAGLSQGALAKLVGVSMRTVGNWERGESAPGLAEQKLMDVLREHLDDGAGKAPLRSVSDVELLAEIARRFARAEQRERGEHGGDTAATRRPAPSGPNQNADEDWQRVFPIRTGEEADAFMEGRGRAGSAAEVEALRNRTLSAADDTVPDAVAAHEEEGSIAGEQEESDTP